MPPSRRRSSHWAIHRADDVGQGHGSADADDPAASARRNIWDGPGADDDDRGHHDLDRHHRPRVLVRVVHPLEHRPGAERGQADDHREHDGGDGVGRLRGRGGQHDARQRQGEHRDGGRREDREHPDDAAGPTRALARTPATSSSCACPDSRVNSAVASDTVTSECGSMKMQERDVVGAGTGDRRLPARPSPRPRPVRRTRPGSTTRYPSWPTARPGERPRGHPPGGAEARAAQPPARAVVDARSPQGGDEDHRLRDDAERRGTGQQGDLPAASGRRRR